MHVYVYVYVYADVDVDIDVCVYIYIYVYVCVYVYACIQHMYTTHNLFVIFTRHGHYVPGNAVRSRVYYQFSFVLHRVEVSGRAGYLMLLPVLPAASSKFWKSRHTSPQTQTYKA